MTVEQTHLLKLGQEAVEIHPTQPCQPNKLQEKGCYRLTTAQNQLEKRQELRFTNIYVVAEVRKMS
ncbi:hypothetical protein ACOSP7_002837 [Xanthoceras sorbifolium]